MAGRTSQEVLETLTIDDGGTARVSQLVAEVEEVNDGGKARVSQLVAEVEEVNDGGVAHVSQLVVEAANFGTPRARVSQLIIEILVPNLDVVMPAVYPALIGLGYSVNWKPQFFGQSTVAASGANIDLALSQSPIHDFELTYDFMRDVGWDPGQFFGPSEFKELFGFFLAVQGPFGGFLFKNPDDHIVKRQVIATTDGVAHLYRPLVRTFGVGSNSGSEAVGYVDLTQEFNLYLDDVWQPPATYTVLTTIAGDQQVQFVGVPTIGQVISVDMSYFYYCKFVDNQMTFEKFMDKLWRNQSVNLRTRRAGT